MRRSRRRRSWSGAGRALGCRPEVADGLVEAGVTVIFFNYTEQLLQVPPKVTVHTQARRSTRLRPLYFYLS